MYPQEESVQPRDRRAWTEEEDELLRAAIDKEDPEANPPSKWHAIAKHIPNRTNKDCRKRWWAQMATRVSKGSWSTEEDERLFSAVDELGTKWAAVAGRVGTRNSGQCAKRWNDALNPAIDRSGWTPEEDQKLLKAVEHQGHSWANIARTYLPGRTGLAAKNRYNHLIRGSSDRASSTRGRRMSTASAMRRRTARGSSISSLSSPPSPRSTVTPPPSRSSASSPGSSGMLATVADGLAAHSPIDLRHQWNPILSDGSLLDDVPELTPSGSSRASSTYSHSSSPSLESQMLSMIMQNSLNEFFDPALDPAAISPLGSSYSMESCSPDGLLPGSSDPWASGYFPYLDFANPSAHNSMPFDPQLTPSLSPSTSGSSVSTPQLSDPHFSMHNSRYLAMSEPHVAIAQYPGLSDFASSPFMQPGIDPNDPRLAGAYGLCDRQSLELSHGLSNMLGHPMTATA